MNEQIEKLVSTRRRFDEEAAPGADELLDLLIHCSS